MFDDDVTDDDNDDDTGGSFGDDEDEDDEDYICEDEDSDEEYQSGEDEEVSMIAYHIIGMETKWLIEIGFPQSWQPESSQVAHKGVQSQILCLTHFMIKKIPNLKNQGIHDILIHLLK